ncbi:MAG: hypothetical protein DYG98_21005 [Haliscomenobacteraceae bacterium CHB4]|nr:hypothetical protein [Saprospiraceae bacterium]MCE7925539.1 hypothetical protein [Haliscomenobacteraceae bacterium CHB4]
MKTGQLSIGRILIGVLVLLLPLTGTGQKTARPKTVFEHLTQEEAVKMTLEADLTTILENRKKDQYYPATLSTEDGKSYKVEIKLRGKYRRKIAEIPPLKLKFKKKDLVAQGFDTLNEIKLVLPAYDNVMGNELVVKEYLAYRMFEKITSASVRARLVRLTIRDMHVEQTRKVYAIMVEDEEETAARMNGQLIEQYGMSPDSLILNQAALVSVFQYMIGNTDWEISMMRNVRLIKSPETGKVLVIPYDFDFSGFVSAPYASPSSESGLKTVRDRFMMANGIKKEYLKRALNIVRTAKDDLYNICRSKHLPRNASDGLIDYLETFFIQIEEKDEVPMMFKMPETD